MLNYLQMVLLFSQLIIQDWAFNGKVSFNPDPTKQAKKVIFSKKLLVLVLPYLLTIH